MAQLARFISHTVLSFGAAAGLVLFSSAPSAAQTTIPTGTKSLPGGEDRDAASSAGKAVRADSGQKPDAVEKSGNKKIELGASYGQGAFLSAHGTFTVAGIEACLRCRERFAFFAQYDHWWLTPPGGQTSVLDLGSAGLRIQGRNKYVRPFFDVGIAAGYYDGHPHNYVHRDETIALAGVTLGAGITVTLPRGFYVRPQAKLAFGAETAVGFGSVGVGYRF
jgi:hypothetical protein